MSWISDRMLQRKQLESCHALVLQHAERVYGLLWQEMSGWIEEARKRGIELTTNGSPYERLIVLPVRPNHEQTAAAAPRNLTLTLEKDKHSILVAGLNTPLELQLDVCPDNTVCLKHDGVEISIHDAAILILDPFLFPELIP